MKKTASYNKDMKRFFIILTLIFTLTLVGCYAKVDTDTSTSIVIPSPAPVPTPTPDNDDVQSGFDDIEERKKQYAVSTTNGLRIRSGASTSHQVVGYLDKNDAVLIIKEKDGFYETVYKEKVAFVSKQYCTVMEIDVASDKEENALDLGCTLLGYPYVWGSQRYHWGNGKLNANFINGEFDCSALVQYIFYKANGTILDVTTRTQVHNGTEVSRENLSRGDLMFFTNQSRQNKTGTERIGHVGIYFGNNYILHTASDHAVIEPISQLRWSYYITARRVV